MDESPPRVFGVRLVQLKSSSHSSKEGGRRGRQLAQGRVPAKELLVDAAAEASIIGLMRGSSWKKFAIRNALDCTRFLQRLDKDQCDEKPQKGRDRKRVAKM